MTLSAAPGIPGMPSRVAVSPSCMCPSPRSVKSSSWHTIGNPVWRAYSSAWRMTAADMIGRPSSESATAPARWSASAGASRSPFCPTVTAASGWTRQCPASRARASTHSIHAALSTTGSVLGIAHTAVKPPAAAARVPLAIVSLNDWPGSRRWTCVSTRPGASSAPPASTTAVPRGAWSTMRPSATASSRAAPVRQWRALRITNAALMPPPAPARRRSA